MSCGTDDSDGNVHVIAQLTAQLVVCIDNIKLHPLKCGFNYFKRGILADLRRPCWFPDISPLVGAKSNISPLSEQSNSDFNEVK